MPARVVDGEAIWTSKKVKRLPEKFRLHYANLLPLAEANGVFDADPSLIYVKVYAFWLPDFNVTHISRMLAAFVKEGLLRIWEQDDRQWGYFIGIDKPGRLPSEKHLQRYKTLPPAPPLE